MMSHHLTPVRTTSIDKSTNTKCWRGREDRDDREDGEPRALLAEMSAGAAAMKHCGGASQNEK